jgi:hypothetical protein
LTKPPSDSASEHDKSSSTTSFETGGARRRFMLGVWLDWGRAWAGTAPDLDLRERRLDPDLNSGGGMK